MSRCHGILLVALAFVFAACGELPSLALPTPTLSASPTPPPTSAQLIGHWRNPENGYIMSFYRDGTLTYASRCGLSIGNYRFLEENLIRIDWQAQGDTAGYSQILDIKIESDSLTLTSLPQAPALKLTRVPNRLPQTTSTPCSTEPM